VLLGGLVLGAWGGFRRRVVTSFVGLLVMGAGLTLVGLMPPSAFWLTVGLFLMAGFTNPMVNGPLFAVVQAVVAPEMQGRVFTLLLSAAGAMSPLSLLVAGPLADRLGVQTWFVAAGVITALVGFAAFFIPAVMNIEEGNGSAADGAALTSAEKTEVGSHTVAGGESALVDATASD
jgi:DHA3 family macrolide efflux protein-like MFS transporter